MATEYSTRFLRNISGFNDKYLRIRWSTMDLPSHLLLRTLLLTFSKETTPPGDEFVIETQNVSQESGRVFNIHNLNISSSNLMPIFYNWSWSSWKSFKWSKIKISSLYLKFIKEFNKYNLLILVLKAYIVSIFFLKDFASFSLAMWL